MDSKEIYKKVEYLIKERNLTNKKVCEDSGISLSSLYNWRTRETMPTFETLSAICETLDIPLASLFMTDTKYDSLSSDLKKLLDEYSCLNAMEKKAVRIVIGTFLKQKK